MQVNTVMKVGNYFSHPVFIRTDLNTKVNGVVLQSKQAIEFTAFVDEGLKPWIREIVEEGKPVGLYVTAVDKDCID